MKFPPDPIARFAEWYAAAEAHEGVGLHDAMSLATATADGRPSVRTVLLKGHGPEGFVFYTNLRSRKAEELTANPWAALGFWWDALNRQVRIEGPVEPVADEVADAYFASRARDSRIGAWASKQSQPLVGRWELEKRVATFAAKYAIGAVPRPEFWSGFRVVPETIEFWERGTFRLHMRQIYTRTDAGWDIGELYP